jgi:hypothetical protein
MIPVRENREVVIKFTQINSVEFSEGKVRKHRDPNQGLRRKIHQKSIKPEDE